MPPSPCSTGYTQSCLPAGCALLRVLLLLGTLCHLTVSLGYPSPCDGSAPPNDPVPGHGVPGPGAGPVRRPTVAFLLTGGIPSSQPGLLGFHRTVRYVSMSEIMIAQQTCVRRVGPNDTGQVGNEPCLRINSGNCNAACIRTKFMIFFP